MCRLDNGGYNAALARAPAIQGPYPERKATRYIPQNFIGMKSTPERPPGTRWSRPCLHGLLLLPRYIRLLLGCNSLCTQLRLSRAATSAPLRRFDLHPRSQALGAPEEGGTGQGGQLHGGPSCSVLHGRCGDHH